MLPCNSILRGVCTPIVSKDLQFVCSLKWRGVGDWLPQSAHRHIPCPQQPRSSCVRQSRRVSNFVKRLSRTQSVREQGNWKARASVKSVAMGVLFVRFGDGICANSGDGKCRSWIWNSPRKNPSDHKQSHWVRTLIAKQVIRCVKRCPEIENACPTIFGMPRL